MSAALALREPDNRVQHGFRACLECGRDVVERPGRRGPAPSLHRECRRQRRRRAQLRAYLAAAARIADELGDELAAHAIRKVPTQISIGDVIHKGDGGNS